MKDSVGGGGTRCTKVYLSFVVGNATPLYTCKATVTKNKLIKKIGSRRFFNGPFRAAGSSKVFVKNLAKIENVENSNFQRRLRLA